MQGGPRSLGGQDGLVGGQRPLEQGPGELEDICFDHSHQESEAPRQRAAAPGPPGSSPRAAQTPPTSTPSLVEHC